MIIAVDGPAGSGKSSVCSLLADRLGWTYVNTGAIYRALGLVAVDQGISLNDEEQLATTISNHIDDVTWDARSKRLFVGQNDVTDRIKTAEAGRGASAIARMPKVRELLLDLQRRLALQTATGSVVDGRDIGTVIFPDADLKIFLTASLDERAKRRFQELNHTNEAILDHIRSDIASRDVQDSERDAAPLKQADDAIVVDTTGHSIEEVIATVIQLLEDRGLVRKN